MVLTVAVCFSVAAITTGLVDIFLTGRMTRNTINKSIQRKILKQNLLSVLNFNQFLTSAHAIKPIIFALTLYAVHKCTLLPLL